MNFYDYLFCRRACSKRLALAKRPDSPRSSDIRLVRTADPANQIAQQFQLQHISYPCKDCRKNDWTNRFLGRGAGWNRWGKNPPQKNSKSCFQCFSLLLLKKP